MSYVVDVIGKEAVIDRFSVYECPAFSVWQGKQLKFVYDEPGSTPEAAAAFLGMNLDALHDFSTALYEVRLYKDVPDKGIDAKTPIRGSFTFKMNTGMTPATAGAYNQDNTLVGYYRRENEDLKKRLEALESKQMAGIGDVQQEDPQIQKISGIVDIIDNSPFLQKVGTDAVEMLKGLLGNFGLLNNQQPTPAAAAGHQISGIEIPADLTGPQKIEAVIEAMVKTGAKDNQEASRNLDTLSESLRVLLERDPDLLNTFHRLSQLSVSKYNMAKGFL